MLAQNLANEAIVQWGSNAGPAIEALFPALAISPANPLSAEEFALKILQILSEAEKKLPDTLKQNNFGYSIGEGGAFRGTIKATVLNQFTVIG